MARGRKRSVIYMAVTPDEYELPLYVADTIEELAERYGVAVITIHSAIHNGRTGKVKGYKFAKTKII